MFVDASALVALALGEPDARILADRLERASDPITSPIAVYEAVLAVVRERRGGVAAARTDIGILLAEAHIRVMPVELEDADLALEAFARFGKGQGHPARLNMGDCFAYAGARRNGVTLLFKGDDFTQTDIEI